ncbi:laccase lcc5 [Lentinula edodes]|uniref:laccase n=1 Tax=Lentinula lateritia TaxID=40482 RepID=A0A9W9AY16_9AGAR|nr:laccase lcc5 [Lentinula edodes]
MGFQSFTSLLSLIALVPSAFAVLETTGDLVIANAAVSPDGFSRTAVLAGGGVVGELITGNKGDNFQINVVNELTDDTMLRSTTVHWHGIFQEGTNWADGPAFINQCPIAANNSFLYDFTVSDQAGTFWYHSHLSTQYCDGLRGPLVIYDPDDPYADLYDVDDDTTVISLMDWYHEKAETLTFPFPDASLINGLGRYSGGNATDLSVITVTSGTRYRFRLVNLACDPNFVFSIDNHTMTVIEADGVNHEQLVVDSIQIFAGQRYSFILEANQSVDNYWIRADPSTGTSGYAGGINSAILRYSGAADSEPGTPEVTSVLALNETQLVPLENPGAPGEPEVGGVDYALNLAMAFTGTAFTINGYSFTSPTVPVLLQILSGAETADSLLPTGSVYALPTNSTIEISIPSGGLAGFPHPFHLHGHTFDVVRSAGSTTYNYANPARRDVVSTGAAGDNVTIRFTTDNAGPWFLHCHIDWHLEAGLAIVFAEDVADWNTTQTPSTAWDDLCPIYDALSADQL